MLDIEGAFLDKANEELLVDLFDCNRATTFEEMWLVFRFYESCVETADVFYTQTDAKREFNDQIAGLRIRATEVKVTEYNPEAKSTICTVYNKHNVDYSLPDKPTRIAMVCLTSLTLNDTIVIK